MDKDKQIQKVTKLSLEKLSEDSKLVKRGLRDLNVWPKIEDIFNKLKEKYEAGLFDECIQFCLEILETNPNHFLTLSYCGCCLYQKDEYDKAISIFNKALEIDPNYYVLYYSRGAAYCKKGEYDKAISDYSKALEIEPNDPDIYYMLGVAYYQKVKRKNDRSS
jgi:tetratricopeptide (TPR) repeat protein